jgi:hypothetical protein
MRIVLRTSGGRGEYEVAGSHGSVSVSDVIDHQILLQIFPNKKIITNNWIRRSQGKPRIRLGNTKKDQHIYLTISDILLMPKPKREVSKTPDGKIQLTENNYAISSIQFDIVSKINNSIIIQPTDLILTNSSEDLARIDILERLRIILNIWQKASQGFSQLSSAIRTHRDSVLSGNVDGINSSTLQIRKMLDFDDPLKEILREFSLLDQYTYWMGIHRNDVESAIVEEDSTDLQEAARKRIMQWRLQASRGSKGAKFSREVKAAYDNRCLFSGYYLPKSALCSNPGVDSAHILPWAEYDIDSINNGLCLNKLCHWAFDNGILLLKFNKTKSEYKLFISSAALQAEKNGLISLEGFRPLEGKIPAHRLPKDKRFWPSPHFLEEYNNSISYVASLESR